MSRQEKFNLEQRLNVLREHFVKLDGSGLNHGNLIDFRDIVLYLNSKGFIVHLNEITNRLQIVAA